MTGELKPHSDWIMPHANREDRHQPYAAGISDEVRIFFIPASAIWTVWSGNARLRNLPPDGDFRAFWFDPKTGREYPHGEIRADEHGDLILPRPPIFQDWLIVLEKKGGQMVIEAPIWPEWLLALIGEASAHVY
jgi:hypothetical protein